MKTLKLQNVPAILIFVVWCTALLIVCIGAPNDFWAELGKRFTSLNAKDGLLLSLTPLVSLVANGLFSPTAKAVLVFWRFKNVLPGHRAFSKHVNADPRVNVQALRERVVPWPDNPTDENRVWYKIYRSVEEAVQVVDAHRSFLLARDLGSIAFTFVVVGAPIVYFLGKSIQWTLCYVAVMVIQYLILALVARNHGVRMVRNVLVEVSNKSDTPAA